MVRHVLVMLMHNGDMDAHPLIMVGRRGFTVENEEHIEGRVCEENWRKHFWREKLRL